MNEEKATPSAANAGTESARMAPQVGVVTVAARDFAALCEERAEARVRLEIARSEIERLRAEVCGAKEDLDNCRNSLDEANKDAELYRGLYYQELMKRRGEEQARKEA